VLSFQVLAASAAVSASVVVSTSLVAHRVDGSGELAAKSAPALAKPDPGASRQTSASRSVAPAVIRAAEEVSPVRPAPTRASAYVCPSDMVMIGRSYCVDIYEASVMQVLPDGSEKPWPFYQVIPRGVVTRAVSEPGVFPQGYISGLQARASCERSGKRLCKTDEWRNACMGPKKTTFPYGSRRETGRCNDNGRSAMRFFNPGLDDKPEHRWMWGQGGNMNDPRLNQLEGTLARTGERTGCTNEYGVFDMVGNLHEWVDDPEGTFQGGYYLDTHLNGDGCYYRTTAHPLSHNDYSTGFRCCADVASI
jgi:sulfatase modifying factor 1